MKFSKKNISIILGVIVGAGVGFAYYSFIGCNSGSCPITSRPVPSTLYGSVLGGLLFSLLIDTYNNSKSK